jgi:hypothetical protein
MTRSTILRTSTLGALCVLAGGAAGIAGTSASSPSNLRLSVARGERGFFKTGPLSSAAGPPVHSDAVVPNKSGGFDTITTDRGSFSSLSGGQLTITEGTKSATYKTVTLTIPPGATIRRNGAPAQLSDLKAGDEVNVLQGPKGSVVIAHDAQHQLRFQRGGLRHRDGLPPAPGAPPVPDEGSSRGSQQGGSS